MPFELAQCPLHAVLWCAVWVLLGGPKYPWPLFRWGTQNQSSRRVRHALVGCRTFCFCSLNCKEVFSCCSTWPDHQQDDLLGDPDGSTLGRFRKNQVGYGCLDGARNTYQRRAVLYCKRDQKFEVEKDSNLYLLLYRDKGLFKIGKADDIHVRSKRLRWLGEPDYSASYFIVAPRGLVFRLESLLKNLLKPVDAESWLGTPTFGDGHTEVFPLALWGEVLEIMARYCARNPMIRLSKLGSRPRCADVGALAVPRGGMNFRAPSGRRSRKSKKNYSHGMPESTVDAKRFYDALEILEDYAFREMFGESMQSARERNRRINKENPVFEGLFDEFIGMGLAHGDAQRLVEEAMGGVDMSIDLARIVARNMVTPLPFDA